MAVAPAWLAQSLPWDTMAARIATTLRVAPGETVILRFNPDVMPALEPAVRAALERAGAKVETISRSVPGFEQRLAAADVYVWLPGASGVTGEADQKALKKWVDAGGTRREHHFHWLEGTLLDNGLAARHTETYDRLYLDALDIDYAAMAAEMDDAIARLRAGEVRVTTAAGTDLRFRVGDRPFNRQTGDASRAHARKGRIRIDRHTELPAGVMRVAPLENSVNGVLVLPGARFGAVRATNVRLVIRDGVVSEASATSGADAVKAFLASEPGASRFREFALGFNPKLTIPAGEQALPYYGYGAGVVRMSLGDNNELGGSVRGGGIRWLFFPDATVVVGGAALVDGGRLVRK
jgi:hypothetical protein